jgi:hypothetical protein
MEGAPQTREVRSLRSNTAHHEHGGPYGPGTGSRISGESDPTRAMALRRADREALSTGPGERLSGVGSQSLIIGLPIYHSGRITTSTARHRDARPSSGVVLDCQMDFRVGWAGVSSLAVQAP